MPTKIEWCDETWNPITGCTPISEGCANCYAKRMFSRKLWNYDFTPATVHPERFHHPSRWKEPRKVFVCSMGDLFHHKVVAQKWEALFNVWSIMGQLPRHTFIVLTKRPEMAYSQLHPMGDLSVHLQRQDWCKTWPLPNVWLGVTAENQERANERIPILQEIPAAVRVVSVEPMLGPVELWQAGAKRRKIQWVIAGPETGPGARECDPHWLNDLREANNIVGTAFFDKRKPGGDVLGLCREYPYET